MQAKCATGAARAGVSSLLAAIERQLDSRDDEVAEAAAAAFTSLCTGCGPELAASAALGALEGLWHGTWQLLATQVACKLAARLPADCLTTRVRWPVHLGTDCFASCSARCAGTAALMCARRQLPVWLLSAAKPAATHLLLFSNL